MAVAVGIPNQASGEAVKVYIVLRDGQSATDQEILDFCRTRMANYTVPRFLEFRAELPKNMIDRVLRRARPDQESRRAVAHAG